MKLTELDLIQIASSLRSIEEFLGLILACPDDDVPQRVVELMKASATICSLKCENIDAVLEGRAVYLVREAGEA